ncbi:unnamed protein product [Bursaphelenchus xylophilus]|uniref:(pine wood nematode) hypothetical protein n=1 Tax=Bursaphelenchus xylophilus TaxID=6326 RepID=A0A1I7RTS1_BURXY|nr:unnamed protein product [Bursaphelenchus xylophilus]CAG9122174.1 unnamed protein product [Bursaphelenchus xylophilus]
MNSTETGKKEEGGSSALIPVAIVLAVILVPILIIGIILCLYRKFRKREKKPSMSADAENLEDPLHVLSQDMTRRPREPIKGNVLSFRDKIISTNSEYSSMTGRLTGAVNVSVLAEGEGEMQCVMNFEADDSPHKRLRSVHQLVHRLNQQGEFALGVLICGVIMPAREAEITHECPRGRISDGEQEVYFALYDFAGISLSEFVRIRPTKIYAIEIATKALQALYVLHSQKYCHGKLTPASFYVDEETAGVSLIDLGFLHPLKGKQKWELYYVYEDINFDPLYQSAVSHYTSPPSVMSDLESWSYIFVQLLVGRPLPWYGMKDKMAIQELKVQFTHCGEPFRFYTKDIRPDMVYQLREMYFHLTSSTSSELGEQLTVKYQVILDFLAQMDAISEKRRLGEELESNKSPRTPQSYHSAVTISMYSPSNVK